MLKKYRWQLPLWRRQVRGRPRPHAAHLPMQLLDLPAHALLARRGAEHEGFRALAGEDELTQYLFNTRRTTTGSAGTAACGAFGIGNDTPIGKMYGVNVGCLEDVSDEELSRVPHYLCRWPQ